MKLTQKKDFQFKTVSGLLAIFMTVTLIPIPPSFAAEFTNEQGNSVPAPSMDLKQSLEKTQASEKQTLTGSIAEPSSLSSVSEEEKKSMPQTPADKLSSLTSADNIVIDEAVDFVITEEGLIDSKESALSAKDAAQFLRANSAAETISSSNQNASVTLTGTLTTTRNKEDNEVFQSSQNPFAGREPVSLSENDPILKLAKEKSSAVVSGTRALGGIDAPTVYNFFNAEGKFVAEYVIGGMLNSNRWSFARLLTTAEKAQVKTILGKDAFSVQIIVQGYNTTILVYRDKDNTMIGQKVTQTALDKENPLRSVTSWRDSAGKTVRTIKVLADGNTYTTYTTDGDNKMIQLIQNSYPDAMGKILGRLQQLIISYKNGEPSQASLSRYDAKRKLTLKESYNQLTARVESTKTCPASDVECSTVPVNHLLNPAGDSIGGYKTINTASGSIADATTVTKTFGLFGVITQIHFPNEHKTQFYSNGVLRSVTVLLDPDPICPEGHACKFPYNPFATTVTVNFKDEKASTATVIRRIKEGNKLDYVKTFESLDAFKAAESECPNNPEMGMPCAIQQFPKPITDVICSSGAFIDGKDTTTCTSPSPAKEFIANIPITTLGGALIKTAWYDFSGLLVKMAESTRVQVFKTVDNVRQLVSVTETNGDTRIVVNYNKGIPSDARVETLANGKVVKAAYYRPVIAETTLITSCPLVGDGPCVATRPISVIDISDEFVEAGLFKTRAAHNGMDVTTSFRLYGVLTEERYKDGTRLFYGDITNAKELNGRGIVSMVFSVNGRQVRVNVDHNSSAIKPDWEVAREALVTDAPEILLKSSPLVVSNYRFASDGETICSPGAEIDGVPHFSCSSKYTFDISNKNKKIKYSYLAQVVENTPPYSKNITVGSTTLLNE